MADEAGAPGAEGMADGGEQQNQGTPNLFDSLGEGAAEGAAQLNQQQHQGGGYDWEQDAHGLKQSHELPEGVELAGKYRSVADLEKGYINLQQMMGSKGPPEKYDFTSLSAEIPAEQQATVAAEWKENGFSQDQAAYVIDLLNRTMAPPSQAEIVNAMAKDWNVDPKEAAARIAAVDQWGRANLGELWGALRDLPITQSPDTLSFLDKVRQANGGKKVWDEGGAGDPAVPTRQELDAMQSRLVGMEAHDPEYATLLAKLEAGFAALYGNAPASGMKVG